jgi:signal transduction histidine kinase
MGTWNPEEGEYRWISVNAVPLFRPGEERAYQVYTLFDDITEHKRAAEALKDSEARYRELFENSLQSIVIFELVRNESGQMVDLRIVDANSPFEQEMGISLGVMQGKCITEVFGTRTAAHAIAIAREVMASGKGRHVEQFVPWNEQYYIETYFPILDDRLAIIGLNITYRKKMEGALERSNAELQQFAYIASHDLQEPLRMVSSYLSLLERRETGKLNECSRQYIGFAVDGAMRMSAMINDLLAYSRVESKGREFSSVDMDDVLTVVLRDLKVAVEESGASVTSDHLPTVLADKGQMAQLMENLIGNAIKYRSEAAPQVHVSAQGNGGEWEFSVQDNGIGIDPSCQDRLFKMFQRLHTRDEYEGTGMGLALSRRIVERHGGRIWFESKPGEGSTFRFTIPLR